MSRYSNDLRERVAKKFATKGVTQIEIAQEFDINVSTIREWQKKFKEGTLFDEVHLGGRPVVYDLEGLKQFVVDHSDKYIREIKVEFFDQKGNKSSESGITKALKKMDIRFKKKSLPLKKETPSKDKDI